MAIGTATNASLPDLRNLIQPQDRTLRPVGEQERATLRENGTAGGVDAGIADNTLVNATLEVATELSGAAGNRGENSNPGVAVLARDDRLPVPADPNRGTALDIAV